ncbi:MAG: hypothetical protein GC191_01625 [Azospirillum sp.]|nr:hypothetical protein [Azospirillum sp.]
MIASRDVLVRLKGMTRLLAYGNPLYNLTLAGRTPGVLTMVPPDSWPGDAGAGACVLAGRFGFAGQELRFDEFADADEFWQGRPGAASGWRDHLHSFDWLHDLRAAGGDAPRREARRLIFSWLECNAVWNQVGWAPALIGARIANWLSLHDFYCASADDGFRYCVFDSLGRQTRHLARVLPGDLAGERLIVAIKGLVYGGLCLPDGDALVDAALRLLDRELPRQILSDGGHIDRNPTSVLLVLRHLIDLRASLRVARIEVPSVVQHAIERMVPALRFFRHGDGRLACFNGSREGSSALIDAVVVQADCRGRALKSAGHSGYERIVAGRSLLLADIGLPAAAGADQAHHAGALGFEFSAGKERIIVNCGSHPGRLPIWRKALAATAAHSTLVLGETNSAELAERGGLGRRPSEAGREREESGGATLLAGSHDGYAKGFGFRHRRRWFLAESGEDLRGEDALEPVAGAAPASRSFVVRFHLHPAVDAAVGAGGGGIALRLPGGTAWHFAASGAVPAIEESLYAGSGRDTQHSRQITLTGETPPAGLVVKWSLRRDKSAE